MLEKIESYQSAYEAGSDLTSLTENFRNSTLPDTDAIINNHLQKIVELGWELTGSDGIGLLSSVVDHFT